jgi:hypothetical protein
VNPYQSLRDYEEFVYNLPQQFLSIVSSTLVVVRRGARMVTVSGEVIFPDDYRLVVKERLTFDAGPLVLTRYGYEVWRGGEKLYWYDSQPHPKDPTLTATAPHHPSASSGQASTFPPTSSTTASPRLNSPSPIPTSPC